MQSKRVGIQGRNQPSYSFEKPQENNGGIPSQANSHAKAAQTLPNPPIRTRVFPHARAVVQCPEDLNVEMV